MTETIVADYRPQEPAPMTVLDRVRRLADIHAASCRYCRRGLACGIAGSLRERLARLGGDRG